MSTETQKITANLPAKLLKDTMRFTGEGITATLIEGLVELNKKAKREALAALRGKIDIDIDIDIDLDKTRR